jgi:outer membrane cobalamin receptor
VGRAEYPNREPRYRLVGTAFTLWAASNLCSPHVGHADGSDATPVVAPPATVADADDASNEVIEVSGALPTIGPTGTSTSVVSRKDIEALPGGDALSLSQIVLTQPGFAPDSFGPDGIFHIRGLEAGVLYVVDGIPIPGGLAGQFTDVLPTALVDRVNLVVGGMPVEYGANAGGVFDITTRHGTGDPAGEAEIVYGTYQKIQPSAWYSQAFGKVDVFAAAGLLTTDRGLDTPAVAPILHDAEKMGNAVTRIDYRPDDRDRFEVIARYSEQHFQIPIDPTQLPLSAPGATRAPDGYGNAPPQFVPDDANPTLLERDFFVTAAYFRAIAPGTLEIAPYFRDFYSSLDCDPIRSLGPTADPGSTCSDVANELRHEGVYATYAWNAGTAGHWKAGVTFDDGQAHDSYIQFTRDDAAAPNGPDSALTISGADNTNIVAAGAFVQDEIRRGALTLFPGVRADVQDAIFEGTSQPDLRLAAPSVRLGATYVLDSDFTLHGFAGYLWQPPNAVDSSVAARALIPGLAGQPVPVDLRAETDEAAELGLRYERPNRFDADLTAYGRLSQNTLDVTNVGETNLIVDYNYTHGRAIGTELSAHATIAPYLRGFGNVSWDIAQAKGISSEQYLFTPSELTFPGWQILDHVQKWTANAGIDLHDGEDSHLSISYQYGSGLRTGPDNNETVPGHSVWNLTLRHRFALAFHPEVAVDVFNAFDTAYAIRIGNGFVGSAYGPLREVELRLTIPLGARASASPQSTYESR